PRASRAQGDARRYRGRPRRCRAAGGAGAGAGSGMDGGGEVAHRRGRSRQEARRERARSARPAGRVGEHTMIRVVLFLGLVCLVALGIVWLADRPGEVAITWLGWRIETSGMVLLAAAALVAALLLLLFSLVRGLWRSPRRIARALRDQRERKGRLAVARGLVAVGVGDQGSARRFAQQARRFAAEEPLMLLLDAL